MYEKGSPATVSFFYADEDGLPNSGQSLVAILRLDSGAWIPSSNLPIERAPALAPGFYDLDLTATEMNSDVVAWYARTIGGTFAGCGQLQTVTNGDLTADVMRDAVFTEPTDQADQQTVCAFMDRLADHILRRAMANAERSAHGDAVGASSLLGVMSLLTQGQMVVTNCSGDSYVFLNSSIQGNPPLGTLRVVRNSAGTPIGTLPLVGPNAMPDAVPNCDCTS